MMQRQARGVVVARALEATSLDLERIEVSVPGGVEPLADGIADQRRLDLLGPVAAVGVDAPRVLDPVDQHISSLRRDDELDRLERIHDERHAKAATGGAQPIAETTLPLGFPDSL